MVPWYLQNSKKWIIFSYVEKICPKPKKIFAPETVYSKIEIEIEDKSMGHPVFLHFSNHMSSTMISSKVSCEIRIAWK